MQQVFVHMTEVSTQHTLTLIRVMLPHQIWHLN